MDKYIVAEVTKNWVPGTLAANLLSNKFEAIINYNFARGYKLIDWKFNQVGDTTNVLTETIIAIFEKID